MKKLFIAFGIVMMSLLYSLSVFAADTNDSKTWEYEIYGSGVKLTAYKGTQTDVYVPSKILEGDTEYSVLKLGENLFKDNHALNSATLGDGITEIGDSAFEGATNLVCIVTPESLTTIGDNAFLGCTAFNSVILYDGVTNIGENAFSGCDKLVIYCNENNYSHQYAVDKGINYQLLSVDSTHTEYTSEGITYYILNGEAILMSCDSTVSGSIEIPAQIEGFPVTQISTYTFQSNNAITEVIIPDTVDYIGDGAFVNCQNLKKVRLPQKLKRLERVTFRFCYKLEEINLPDELISIGDACFTFCQSLKNIVLPESLEVLEEEAFYNCIVLEEIIVPKNVTKIPSRCFTSCKSATKIVLPEGVTTLGSGAFSSCESLKTLVIPETVTTIYSEAFKNCKNLKNLVLGPNITTIGTDVFKDTSITFFVYENTYAHRYIINQNLSCYVIKPGESIPKIVTVNYIDYLIDGSEAKAIFCDKDATGEVTLLSEVDGIPVTSVSLGLFKNCANITSIKIDINLERISKEFFSGCTSLKKVTLPNSVRQIDDYAFYNCTALTDITLPEGLTAIWNNVFSYCTSLTSIVIPDSVTFIGDSAFSDCTQLSSVTLSNSLKQIGVKTFYNCSTLTNIILPDSLEQMGNEAFGNCKKLKQITIPSKITSLPYAAFKYCTSLSSVKLHDSFNSFDTHVFQYCESLRSISLPESLTYIGSYAFCESGIASITIPDGVTTINEGTFMSCKNLYSVKLPSNLKTIGTWGFSGCSSLYSINFPAGLELISSSSFQNNTSLNSITFCDGSITIGSSVFKNCSALKQVRLPEGLTKIQSQLFANCSSLVSVEIPSTVTSIVGTDAFSSALLLVYENSYAHNYAKSQGCLYYVISEGDRPTLVTQNYITYMVNNNEVVVLICNPSARSNIVIPDVINNVPVVSINQRAFEGCTKITSVTLPQSITSIGEYAFANCTVLTTVNIPYGIKEIKSHTFYECRNLKSIVLPDSVTEIDDYAFSNCQRMTDITFSENLLSIGMRAFEYCTNLTNIELPKTTTSLSSYVFYACPRLVTVSLPGVSSIGNSCFMHCDLLESVNLSDALYYIGQNAFYDCPSLESITIPDRVTSIMKSVFGYCTALKSVNLSPYTTSIGANAFENCTSLDKVYLPDTLTSIGEQAFYGSGIKTVTLPKNLTSVGSSAFYDCNELKSVKIESDLRSIPYYMFGYCEKLTNVVLPEKLEKFEAGAFASCSSLNYIIMPESICEINSNAFTGANVIFYVFEDSYAHTFALTNNLPYFIIKKTSNPEISYGTSISGTATYTDGTVASGATVEILYDDGTLKADGETDENGNYEFPYAEVGRYTIRVTDTDGNTASEVISVKRMNVFDVYLAGERDLILKTGYSVSGTVTPEIATVTISDTKGNILNSVDTTDGIFAFTNIPRGTYVVKAENKTGSMAVEIDVSSQDVSGITLEIKPQSATITGYTKIENRDKTYFTKIWVNVDLINSHGNVIVHTTTDADGKYTFKNVPEGNYNIVATTTEIRPAYSGNFDKSFELKGYGHIDITEFDEYTVETIILREEKINLTTFSGQVTTNAGGYVYLLDESGNQIAYCETTTNGKFTFKNIPDGVYSITAITNDNGMGFEMISIENCIVYGNTHIKATKANNVSKFEEILEKIPAEIDPENANYHKTYILEAKKLYDDLSETEQKQVSKKLIDRLNNYIDFYLKSSLSAPENVVVENEESIISHDELESEESIEFVLTITETTITETNEDGITSDEEYETEKIKEKKGKNKNIAKYYDITFSKNGKNISNIRKQTETNGKLRITMEIPEEHRGHKHYSFIHMHKGEAVTLIDLDNDPDTVTFEIDKFSTFALAYSDVELVGEVEDETYPASITYDEITGKISVSSTEDGTLYIATYEGTTFIGAVQYPVTAGTNEDICEFGKNQVAYLWNENQEALCEKFLIGN